MSTFNGDAKLRKACLERAQVEQSRMQRGEKREVLWWSRHQWCDPALKCVVPDCKHEFYSKEIGVPVEIAYAERAFYEKFATNSSRAYGWPTEFLSSVPVGVELDGVWREFAMHVLSDNEHGLINFQRDRFQNDAIVRVLELYEQSATEELAWVSAAEACEKIERARCHCSDDIRDFEALALSGFYAAKAAGDFARSFSEPRFAAAAIRSAVEPLRWKTYAEIIAVQTDPRKTAKEWYAESKANTQWSETVKSVNLQADNFREVELCRLADQFLRLIYKKAPPSAISKFFSSIFR